MVFMWTNSSVKEHDGFQSRWNKKEVLSTPVEKASLTGTCAVKQAKKRMRGESRHRKSC